VLLVRTERGAKIQLDAEPNPAGYLVIDGEVCRPYRGSEDGERYVDHFTTCAAREMKNGTL
jgi:hypothetical protein